MALQLIPSSIPPCVEVEAAPTATAQEINWKENFWSTLFLAYRTLGVVFLGLVTSPLCVYPSMHLKSPTEDDYLGIYSIMFWTLSLIGVFKYCCIALKADDQGEGGTFALYSLLCRNANVSVRTPRSLHSNSNLHNSNQYGGARVKSALVTFFEQSVAARRILLFVAMLGMCMLIGDGVLTPAVSVLSAMDGLRAPFTSVSKSLISAIYAVVLVALFLVQKFGTSRVSFLFSPIMGTWTLTTPMKREGWLLLGGTVLCITGIAFLFSIYPSLILTYAGQTAYLIQHPNDHDDGFYKFVPSAVYWPIFVVATLAATVASQSLISATFSIIKQSVVLDYFPRVKLVHTSSSKEGEVYSPEVNYILMVLCVSSVLIFGDGKDLGNAFGVVVSLVMLITTMLLTLVMLMIWRTPLVLAALFFVVFFVMEGVYVSAVCTKIPEGGWLPFVISLVLACIMFGWFYGRQRKLEYEMTYKINLDDLAILLANSEIQRVPGLCFFYCNIQDGLTPVLRHYLKNMRSLHKVTVFTTLRYLLVAKVPQRDRIVVKKLGPKGVYGCVIHYGYADSLNHEGDDSVCQVVNRLQALKQKSSGCLESTDMFIEEEMSELEQATLAGVVHVQGKTRFHIGVNVGWFDKVMLAFYEVLHSNCRSGLPALAIPLTQRMEVGMYYEA